MTMNSIRLITTSTHNGRKTLCTAAHRHPPRFASPSASR
jgi:hypothetical protein